MHNNNYYYRELQIHVNIFISNIESKIINENEFVPERGCIYDNELVSEIVSKAVTQRVEKYVTTKL